MTSNAVAIRDGHGSALTLTPDQDFWNEKQIAGLRQLGIDNASNGDLAVFMHVAQRTGLDPFARQIHFIQRQGKWTIQTGIDGFRLIARRAVDAAKEKLSIGASWWCGQDGQWVDVWVSAEPPAAAKVTVYRNGEEYPGIALWREYVQTKANGEVTAMWKQRPAGQLAKCAEALALRKAFPQDLSGIYTDDEMSSAQQVTATQEPPRTAAERVSEVLGGRGHIEEPAPEEPPADADEDPWTQPTRSPAQSRKMNALFSKLGITSDDGRHLFMTDAVGRQIDSEKDLSVQDAVLVINALVAEEERVAATS